MLDREKEIERTKREIERVEEDIYLLNRKRDALYEILKFYDDNSFPIVLREVLDSVLDKDNYYKTYKFNPKEDKMLIRLDSIIKDKSLRLDFISRVKTLKFIDSVEPHKATSWKGKTKRCFCISIDDMEKLQKYLGDAEE